MGVTWYNPNQRMLLAAAELLRQRRRTDASADAELTAIADRLDALAVILDQAVPNSTRLVLDR